MFKPSLKRSRINEQLDLSYGSKSSKNYLSLPNTTYNNSRSITNATPSLIVPMQLLEPIEIREDKRYSHIFNPLACSF
jgi:hypothetical protein